MEMTNNGRITSADRWISPLMVQKTINRHDRYFPFSATGLDKKTAWKAKLTPIYEFAVVTLVFITGVLLMSIN